MRLIAQAILLSLCLTAAAYAGIGDTVCVNLKRGEPVVGKLVAQDAREIVVETLISNIPYKQTFRQSEILSIQILEKAELTTPVEHESTDSEEDLDEDAEKTSDWVAPTRYMTIPITSGVGIGNIDDSLDTVTPEGIGSALDYARRKKVEHVVFLLDTPGGFSKDADDIVKIIESHGSSITFHAYIVNAISAGMRIAYACDKLWFTSGSSAGGVLSYSRIDTGEIEFDAKQNSIRASMLASSASANGHNPIIARAMVIPEACVYTWHDEQQQLVISDVPPNDAATSYKTIDSDKTVLTLTAADAVALQLGEHISGGHNTLGDLLGVEKWQDIGAYGEKTIQRTTKNIIKAEESRQELVNDILGTIKSIGESQTAVSSGIESARRLNPNNYSYAYDVKSGAFTGESQRLWRERSDAAITAWQQIVDRIDNISKAHKSLMKSVRRHVDSTPYSRFEEAHKYDVEKIRVQLDDLDGYGQTLGSVRNTAVNEIRQLQKERNRSSV
ncbi:MAG: hypothetical protein RLN60_01100 [Phycisphaerales bacterium]